MRAWKGMGKWKERLCKGPEVGGGAGLQGNRGAAGLRALGCEGPDEQHPISWAVCGCSGETECTWKP